jgi:predicted nucleic acid-binding protein
LSAATEGTGAPPALARVTPPAVVLDTNAVLDWLVFRDVRIAPLAEAVSEGRAVWLAPAGGREELRAVLERDQLRRPVNPASVLSQYDRLAVPCASPATSPAAPRCSDPDDQMFLDLAVSTRARWLVTRDKALLTLRARVRHLGLRIAPPEHWFAG